MILALFNASCSNASVQKYPNEIDFKVSRGLGSNAAPNVPFATLTICARPDQTDCQAVDKIVLDTGSQGLRVFRQALPVVLTPVFSGQAQVAECYFYGSGYAWGQVAIASVVLGKEPPVMVPVELIDASFGTPHRPAPCDGMVWQSPSDPHAQVNGVLGIDLERGEFGDYFACLNGDCTPFQPPNSQKVVNPVRALPRDNNGVIISLPSVSYNGQATVSGQLLLGIGTRKSNNPASFSATNVTTINLGRYGASSLPTTADGRSFARFRC
jgi:hypothetical protein